MNMNPRHEKLPAGRLVRKFRFLRFKKRKITDTRAQERRNLRRVKEKLDQWVSEGKHRLIYGSIDDIARELGITGEELTGYCSTRLGKPFLTWRKELRIADAKRLLLESPDTPASKIGKAVGIPDKSNFRSQFKAVTGSTPSEWRRSHLKK